MEKNSDNEETIFTGKESQINLFLNNFIKTLNIEEEDLVDMTSSNLLLESLDKGYNIEYFKKIINEKNLDNKFTGLFLCGFNQNDDLSIIRLIEKYNGTYNVQLNYDQMNREESNEIYAVFSNPLEAYECFGEIDNLNKNNEIEDLSYLL
jgi:GH15 family glucan-1,4-alpha-glucosidase